MRGSVGLAAGVAVLVGLGAIARPGERGERDDPGIVVVRGGAPAGPARFGGVARAAPSTDAPSAVTATSDSPADDEGPGVWATPAEFAQPEPAE